MTQFYNRPTDTRTEVRYWGLRRAARPACGRAPAYAGANSLSASVEADVRRAQRAPGRDFSPDLTAAISITRLNIETPYSWDGLFVDQKRGMVQR
jgi:hypothetical protein